MLHSTHRTVLAFACFLILTYPGEVLAEVSDKEPSAGLFWKVGLIAAVLCLVATRIKPWFGTICFAPAAIWFISLFLEIHSPDVGPYLRAEQGDGYYLQAYAAFTVVIGGLAAGYLWHRRNRF